VGSSTSQRHVDSARLIKHSTTISHFKCQFPTSFGQKKSFLSYYWGYRSSPRLLKNLP
jgi:hypothetical protein